MSKEVLDFPTVNIPETRSSEEDDDSFDRKLEEMKADLEDLENDFSKKTLDDLVKKNYSVPAVRVTHSPTNDLDDPLDKEGVAPGKIGESLKDKRKKSTLTVPGTDQFEVESFKSDNSILFGKEYLNNSQATIKSGVNSSVLSKDHYERLDPDGDCLTSRSAKDLDDISGFDLDKDTLDLIDPDEINDKGVSGGGLAFVDEEVKLQQEGVDQEWQKFLKDAQNEPGEEIKQAEVYDSEAQKKVYHRNLVTDNIIGLTEKKQDAIAPNFYAQTVNENQMISEKDIDHVNFNKNISEILNIEIVLLVLSRRMLHSNLTSDLEIVRWKKFLVKFLKKNGTNHEGLFGMSQIHFSMGMHEVALDY